MTAETTVCYTGTERGRSPSDGLTQGSLLGRYLQVRSASERLCKPLEMEDYVIQSMPDASPVKWHLAHTAWFFETFVLIPNLSDYRPFHPQFRVLFNSYYNAVGTRHPRPLRGMLSRPTVEEVFQYRSHVDQYVTHLLSSPRRKSLDEIAPVVELGIQHEQQHQELIITDLKNAWSFNPLEPTYCSDSPDAAAPGLKWHEFGEQIAWIGHAAGQFAFDNELPRHRVVVRPFTIANRLVTNEEYLAFIDAGGYERPEFWLSDGWAQRQLNQWRAPLYWENRAGEWFERTLAGARPVRRSAPVCHVSYYEADAFASWAEARLPTEAEWETAAAGLALAGNFQETGRFHPSAAPAADDRGPLFQLYGDVWQWTSSAYSPYPGFKAAGGALGEYNGKFMCNQFVLRGASCATPRCHARATYRNFFSPDARWQFSGIRLAKEPS